MSHSLKYLARLPSSLKLMSWALKSSSAIHEGNCLALRWDLSNACSESLGTPGFAVMSESMKALLFCLLSTVFMTALPFSDASVRMTRPLSSLRYILLFELLMFSTGISG